MLIRLTFILCTLPPGIIDDNNQDATTVKERYVENAVDALLSGKKPNPELTKAMAAL